MTTPTLARGQAQHHRASAELPVALITGAGKRLGATMARHFHQQGYRVAIHYRSARREAADLVNECRQQRADSAIALQADLADIAALQRLPQRVIAAFGRLDLLINNASSFFPTPLGSVNESQWDRLLDSNVKGPFFLSQACLPQLREQRGCIINIVDIHADRPLRNHPAYCIAKAGLVMMTKALALEASPSVRVNAIAPGAILWPAEDSQQLTEESRRQILARIPLGERGEPADIARTAWFLATQAPYITGQIISVDGGRTAMG